MPNEAALSAEVIAMSASCSTVGVGLTAQSPKTRTPSAMPMRNTLETTDTPRRARMISSAGLIVSAVVCAAPDTMPSAKPASTMSVPKYVSWATASRACSSVTPLWARSSW